MKKTVISILAGIIFLIPFTSTSQQTVMIGTAPNGGIGFGTSFDINTGGTGINTANMVGGGVNGANPFGSVVKGSNGKFYMTVKNGGASSLGGIIEMNSDFSNQLLKVSFDGTGTGANPTGALYEALDGNFYGMTSSGGTNNYGTIFKYVPGATSVTVVHQFNGTTGSNPMGTLIESNNLLWGLTSTGGSNGMGTFFKFDYSTSTYTHSNALFGTNGSGPVNSFSIGLNGKLYATCKNEGLNGYGTVIEITPPSMVSTIRHHYANNATDGGNSEGNLTPYLGSVMYGVTPTGGAFGFGCIYTFNTTTGINNVVYSFQNTSADGGAPKGSLTQSTFNGKFYGVTSTGGISNYGTIFELDPAGNIFTKKHDFSSFDGTNLQNITLMEHEPLSATISGTNVTCNGACDGSATVVPSGGTPPYTYNWTAGGTSATRPGLCNGTYTCTITEAGGASINKIITLTQPLPLSVSVSGTNLTCFSSFDGTATATPIGGTGPYTYSWPSSGGSTSTITGLFAGSHTCNVTDANGCVASDNITLTEPGMIFSGSTSNDVFCFGGSNGAITINSPTGGTGAYTYSWAPFGGTGITASGLTVGSYTCTITDVNGCTGSHTANINQPTAVGVSLIVSDALCNGSMNGSITATGLGGTGAYTYFWTPGGMTTAIATGLGAGTYTCVITDANGCTSSSSGTVLEPSAIVSSASGTDVLCNGGTDGTAVNNPTGGTPPYTYLWSPSGQTTQTAIGLSAGNHNVTITDANGCIAFDLSTVGEPSALLASASQTIIGCAGLNASEAYTFVVGGSSPYTYSWSPSGGTNDVEPGLTAGTYTCFVTDNHGCDTSATVTVTENPSTDLTGTITAPTLNINNGFVYAFKQQASINGIDTVAITPIVAGVPNTYIFTGLQADNYYIKVVPHATTFPTAVPTYYGDVFQWDSSQVVTHGCSVTSNVDINIIELLGGTGTGFISGFIIEGDGFIGLRLANNGNNPNVPFAPGGPLKGIDVKLGRNPGGGIQARTTSDSTGYYDFKDLPVGDYTVYVDVPNLPMDSTRNVSISGADTSLQNNYYADSLMIFIDTNQAIGIYSSQIIYSNEFSIYPNPSKGIINISYNVEKENDVILLEFTNVMGQIVKSSVFENSKKGTNIIALDVEQMSIKAGVYFISIIQDNKKYTHRIVIIE